MNSLKASLLAAIPDLPDPNFNKSVVLLIDHDQDEGAFGVILNRPTGISVRKIWEQIGSAPCLSDEQLHQGGPVSGTLIALHGNAEFADLTVMEGLYASTQEQQLTNVVNQSEFSYRLYSGYSGWGAGQLESEVDAGGWLITQARPEIIFEPTEELWKSVADSIAQRIILAGVGPNAIPLNPDVN